MQLRKSALALLSLLAAMPAISAPRTFVSGVGDDANPCTRTQACRSFARAMTETDDGGEVVALDSAGFGPLTITKSVALIAPIGVHAAITASSGSAITVNVPEPGARVVLRNLYINSIGAVNGINVSDAASLYVEHCTVNGFVAGLMVQPVHDGKVVVTDSTFRENEIGLYVDSAALQTVDVTHSSFTGGHNGALVVRAVTTFRDSIFTRNTISGVTVAGNGLGPGSVEIESSTISSNTVGIAVYIAAVVVRNSSVFENHDQGIWMANGYSGSLTIDGSDCSRNGSTGLAVGTGASAAISGSTFTNNVTNGISVSGAGAVARISRNTISGNATGIVCAAGGTFRSTGDNLVEGNTTGNNSMCMVASAATL
jgi:hypothetical protein